MLTQIRHVIAEIRNIIQLALKLAKIKTTDRVLHKDKTNDNTNRKDKTTNRATSKNKTTNRVLTKIKQLPVNCIIKNHTSNESTNSKHKTIDT